MKLNFSLGHCECDGHTVHKFSQRRLTADWLSPQQSDCLRMHSKVSSDWLPSSLKATPPVLEIFKMSGYFPDNPRTSRRYATVIGLWLCCLYWDTRIQLSILAVYRNCISFLVLYVTVCTFKFGDHFTMRFEGLILYTWKRSPLRYAVIQPSLICCLLYTKHFQLNLEFLRTF
jgi:hypothetical protein